MKTVVQRVSQAEVMVEGKTVGRIGPGLLALVAIHQKDTENDLRWMAKKIVELRIFSDDEDKLNLSLQDVHGQLLVVSQFTLYADARKGRRPSFIDAALPEVASPLVDRFVELLQGHGVPTQTGQFGAHMEVEIHNDGPVTIWLEK